MEGKFCFDILLAFNTLYCYHNGDFYFSYNAANDTMKTVTVGMHPDVGHPDVGPQPQPFRPRFNC